MKAFNCPKCGADHHCIGYREATYQTAQIMGVADDDKRIVIRADDDSYCTETYYICHNCGHKWDDDSRVAEEMPVTADGDPDLISPKDWEAIEDFRSGGMLKLPWDK